MKKFLFTFLVLLFNFCLGQNFAPTVSNPVPSDSATGVEIQIGFEGNDCVHLDIDVADENHDICEVHFYSEDTTLIYEFTNIEPPMTLYTEWTGATYDSSYSWFVMITDGEDTTYSPKYYFETETNDNGDSGDGNSTFGGLSDSLVSHWRFNNDASDAEGTNHGTVSGATLISGIRRNCYDFDGSNDLIEIPDNDNLDFTASNRLTLSCWVKKGTQSDWVGIVSKDDWKNSGYTLRTSSSDGRTEFIIHSGGNVYVSGSVDISDGAWHHIVGVYDGEQVVIYKDGVAYTGDSYNGDIVANTKSLQVAKWYTNSNYYNGAIDEMSVWNRALTPMEISELYNNGTGLYYDGNSFRELYEIEENLVSVWTFNNNFDDEVGLSDGTNNGATFSFGVSNTCVYIDNTNGDYIDVSSVYGDVADGFTFSLWINIESLSGNSGVFDFSIDDISSDNLKLQQYGSADDFQFRSYYGTTPYLIESSGSKIQYDTWQHWVFTHDTDTMAIWLDGVKISETTGNNAPITRERYKSYIGKSRNTTDDDFIGYIDEFYFWDRELQDEEISNLYNNGDGWFLFEEEEISWLKDSLLHYYSFDVDSARGDTALMNWCVYDLIGDEEFDQGGFSLQDNDSILTIAGKKDSTKYPDYSLDSTAILDFYDDRWDIDFNTTISMWFQFFEGHTVSLINRAVGDNLLGMIAYIRSDSSFGMYYGSSMSRYHGTSFSVEIVDGWNHITLVIPDDVYSIGLFVNGIEYVTDETNYSATTASWSSMKTTVGYENNNSITIVDEIAIFNYGLDSTTIVDFLYNNGDGWFPFVEGEEGEEPSGSYTIDSVITSPLEEGNTFEILLDNLKSILGIGVEN